MGEFPHFPAGLMLLRPGMARYGPFDPAVRPGGGFVAGFQDVS